MGPARKTTLSFGMVNIPIGLVKIQKSSSNGGLKLIAPVHPDEDGKLPERGVAVQQKYVDPSKVVEIEGVPMLPLNTLYGKNDCSRGVPRGRDTKTGEDVIQPIDAEAYEALAERIEYMDLVGFVPVKDLAPYYERVTDAHFVQPQDNTPAKPLAALIGAMSAEKVAGVVRFSVGSREREGVLRLRGDGVLQVLTLAYSSNLKMPDDQVIAPSQVEVPKKERDLARQLVSALTVDASVIDDLEDESAKRQQEMIDSVMMGEMPVADESGDEAPGDLMAALEASIQASKAQKKATATGKGRKGKVAA